MDNRRTRVLVVGVDESDSLAICRLLADNGTEIEAETVSAYEAALATIKRGGLDVCLLDCHADGSKGLDFLRKANGSGLRTPVILITAPEDHPADVEAVRAGAADCLQREQITAPLLRRSIRYAIERSRALNAMRESEEKFRALTEQSLLGILIIKDDRIVFANDVVCKITGYSREELLAWESEGFVRLVYSDDRAFVAEQSRRKQSGSGEVVPRYDFRIVSKNGKMRWLALHSKTVPCEGGNAVEVVVLDITDRKLAEAALNQSEERYRTLVEQAADMICTIDLKTGVVTNVNAYATKILGYDRADILHKLNFLELVHPEDQEPVMRRLHELAAEGKRLPNFPLRIRKADGDYIHVEVNGAVIRDAENNPSTLIGVIRDVTERKKAEESLRESQERYRTLVDNLLTGIYLRVGEDAVFVNERLVQMTGYTEQELLGMSLFDIIHPEDRMIARERAGMRMSGWDSPMRSQYRIVTKNGETRWIELYGSLINYQGKPAILGNVIDITHAKRAEELLRQSEEKYRALFEESKDVVYITTPDGRFLDINPAGLEVFGYSSKDEILKINLARDLYMNPADRKTYQETIARQGYVKDYEILFKRKDGQPVTVMLTANAVRDASGAIVAYRGIMRDVTERKQLEEQLFQAQKMESIGTLAGGIAHDFNNLLGGILGYASFMKTKMTESHSFYKYVDTIERSGMRAAELTSQLLAFARGGKYNSRPVDLNAIVTETLGIIGRTFDKSIEIDIRFYSPLPTVEADAGQIQQLLMNLCVNARDAMPCGGKLLIETNVALLTADYAKAHMDAKPGPYVTVSVTDTGVGICKEHMKRIFEPFFTTKEKGKGTGLGLSMVYGVAKNHGGFVRVYSEPGIGTTFKVYLPASGKTQTKEPAKTEAPRGGNELILVVDDEEPIRDLAKDIFESNGYRVMLAEDGAQAVEIYLKHKDEIKLVILDMVMPKLGGRETFLKLKDLNPVVKALLSTGYSQNGKATEILNSGVRGFIQKPYHVNELLSKVRGILDAKG